MSTSWFSFKFLSKISALLTHRPNMSKRTALIITSAAGIFTLFVTAIYLRRRRKTHPAVNPPDPELRNGNAVLVGGEEENRSRNRSSKRRRKRKMRISDVTSSSTGTSSRARSQCDISFVSESSTVSSVKSSRNSRRGIVSNLPPPGTKEYYDAERLYRLGVDAFETAMSQWEQASLVLNKDHGADMPTSQSGRSSRSSTYETRYSLKDDDIMGPSCSSRGRSEISITATDTRSTLNISTSSKYPEHSSEFEASNDFNSSSSTLDSSSNEIENKLSLFMERAKRLQESFEEVLYTDSDAESDTDMTLTIGYDDPALSDVDSDDESFVSALEVWDVRSLEDHEHLHLGLYESALEAVERGFVRCRTVRTELLDCFSDIEFLAKLHCVRQALDVMLADTTVRDWLIDTGFSLVEKILLSANHNIEHFRDAYVKLIDYVKCPENWEQIEEELKGRKVVSMTFYDIVLDFIIMDSFDDLERPPGSVLTVLGNRWLANSIKETALSTAVWSVLKAKSQMLKCPNGFIAKFYAVSETVSPVFAWGFLGTDEKLKTICLKFKTEVISFLQIIFSFERVRYTTKYQMADDILQLTQERMQNLSNYLNLHC